MVSAAAIRLVSFFMWGLVVSRPVHPDRSRMKTRRTLGDGKGATKKIARERAGMCAAVTTVTARGRNGDGHHATRGTARRAQGQPDEAAQYCRAQAEPDEAPP
jgi:hypothetical protein